jgi:hypothetical protein
MLDRHIAKDIKVLVRFIEIFCHKHHREEDQTELQCAGEAGRFLNPYRVKLCLDCQKLLIHGVSKRIICPKEPKPSCKHCDVHCYSGWYQEKIREVMRFSGMYTMKRGRLDLIWHYFF